MKKVVGSIFVLNFIAAMMSQASAASCEAWQQECARFHGYQTPNWVACMNQPQARYDCSGGGGYSRRQYDDGYYGGGYVREPRPDLCGNWYRECARYHGRGTPDWHDCMHQPQALADCGRY
ncbi:hypothetical protein G8O24_24720 [Bradyrhizobium sp. INPA01-394B]|uniref:DUF3551 domain-containing protein n=1 Tax=Bradyrhizobium campsiandrae TaxID=1729892 RepID=A0ABR7UAW5_9BRAD|nr:hypothetical protein [Bradyrhizobium campsiandrae]MBC9880535.1 hypothetical protein [Bradyrhizobium campsiandrae]MBC9981018.1 hypothetical protein [Bradyrhizobium campsiandrae]